MTCTNQVLYRDYLYKVSPSNALVVIVHTPPTQGALESINVNTRVQSAIEMHQLCEPYIRRRAIRHLEKGRVVIFGAGTGNPFFTTDTAAALRAAEINADIFLKATKVDGVYDRDPVRNADARCYSKVTHTHVHRETIRVMDLTAITVCKENAMPVLVYNLLTPGNTVRACLGEAVGTLVSCDEEGAEFE